MSSRRPGEKAGKLLQAGERILQLRDAVLDLNGKLLPNIGPRLRGLEGSAGRIFYQILSELLPARYQFQGRSFRPALDAFNAKTARLITQLTTFEGRLPMGGSTSPILANLACLALDSQLEAMARKNNWVYTRFIDDISISSLKKIKEKHLEKVRALLRAHGFEMNEEKASICRVKDEPSVTGLVIRKTKPDISGEFIRDLENNILIYHSITDTDMLSRQIFPAEVIRRFRNFLLGQLNFVKFIRGDGDKDHARLKRKLYPRGY